MIQITPHMRVFIHKEAIDFRNGIEGLAAICRYKLQQDPLTGTIFVFINRSRTSIKLLVYDGQGLWGMQKRLSEGRFSHWKYQEWAHARDLQTLIWNGNPDSANYSSDWRPIIPHMPPQ